MKSSIMIGMGLLMINCWIAVANTSFIRDPFEQPDQLSCNEQITTLLKQIQVWKFKGFIKQFDNHFQQIWLVSENQWLAISENVIPNVLFPWHIQSIFTDKIVWQASLSMYCHDVISWTMQLNE